MLNLRNRELHVELLDPNLDHDRFGIRYCTGGYVFQVHDARHGPLLTGPTYPESFNWFDGQGIPDAFNLSPVHSQHTLGTALVIGTGVCDLVGKRVLSFAQWQIAVAEQRIDFTCEQRFEDTTLRLRRSVALLGRTLRSQTRLDNVGSAFVPVRWFPHPFYPQPTNGEDELLWINAPLRFQADAAYTRADNGFIARSGWPWNEGHYLPLQHDAHAPLVLLQRHPQLGLVSASCSYVPSFFPIWGNANTFSWEPFLERFVAPGETLDWTIDYSF